MFLLTENFTIEEFECKCGCGKKDIDERLVNRLQLIRDIVKEPIIILSGCRCIKHNVEINGEINSLHLLGLATDWTIENLIILKRLCNNLIGNWSGGFCYYESRGFVHTDIGKRRRWNP